MTRSEVIALGADQEEIELIQWYINHGCVSVEKYGFKKSDGWL